MGEVKFWSKACWTGILIAVAFGLLLAPLCAEPPDLDDKAVRDRILAEAIPMSQLEKRGEPGEELLYLPDEQSGYSGWVKILYDNGQIHGLGQAKDGKMDGLVTRWHDNGEKKEEGTFKDGKEEGPFTYWYENGQKESEATFKDGKLEGLVTVWYENGQKKQEVTYKDDKKNGLFTEWTEDGVKIGEVTYKDGVIVD
jgi:antitoxin component YwqK of YwqJK toxin-antitoxin module